MKRVCILITGQMRSFKKCYNSLYTKIIDNNPNHTFDIYIHTEYKGIKGGSAKNDYINEENTLEDFKKSIESFFKIKKIIIETNTNRIDYPSYVCDYGPFINLYRNHDILKHIDDKYDIYIRLRPDIILSEFIFLDNFCFTKIINIICSKNSNQGRWLHNRDWDHMVICNTEGYNLWSEYYKFLNYESYTFEEPEIRFNNNGYWVYGFTKNKSIIATQLFMKYLKEKDFKIFFNEKIFTTVVR